MVLAGLYTMQVEDVESAVEAFKNSMDGFSRFCTRFNATIDIKHKNYITLDVEAVIGTTFNERKIVRVEWSGGHWELDGDIVNTSNVSTVLLLKYARFQATTLRVVKSLEDMCTANNLSIVYMIPTDTTNYTISVRVYRGHVLQFTVHVKQNPSMRSPDFKTVILDVNNTKRDLFDLGSFVSTTDLFFQTHEYTFPNPQIGRQETSQLWHAVAKLATLVDKLV